MKKRILIIFLLIISVTVIIGLTCFKKSYHLSKSEIAFNPYHMGDSLFFQSDKGEKDTIKVVSIDKETLHENFYFFTDYIKTYLFGTTWEGYYVNTESVHNHGEAWSDFLTIRAEPNSTKTIMFNLPIENATWYGNEDMENDINKVLKLPSIIFNRGSQNYNDVIIIPSSNQEYRTRNNFVERIYWSKSNGYVGFDMLNGDKWIVIKK